jgi:hypothetical protein
MPAKLKLRQLKSLPAVRGKIFRTGQAIPQSGIYSVQHGRHRVPHEVTLLRGQIFPRCAKCPDAVLFELLRAAHDLWDEQLRSLVRIYLYELPVFEDERPRAIRM